MVSDNPTVALARRHVTVPFAGLPVCSPDATMPKAWHHTHWYTLHAKLLHLLTTWAYKSTDMH